MAGSVGESARVPTERPYDSNHDSNPGAETRLGTGERGQLPRSREPDRQHLTRLGVR
jgi:hypothetical protein